MPSVSQIDIGFQVYLAEGGEVFGAVREIAPDSDEIVIYVENAGDFTVPLSAIAGVHDAKVILHESRVDEPLRSAIIHAHDREQQDV